MSLPDAHPHGIERHTGTAGQGCREECENRVHRPKQHNVQDGGARLKTTYSKTTSSPRKSAAEGRSVSFRSGSQRNSWTASHFGPVQEGCTRPLRVSAPVSSASECQQVSDPCIR